MGTEPESVRVVIAKDRVEPSVRYIHLNRQTNQTNTMDFEWPLSDGDLDKLQRCGKIGEKLVHLLLDDFTGIIRVRLRPCSFLVHFGTAFRWEEEIEWQVLDAIRKTFNTPQLDTEGREANEANRMNAEELEYLFYL